MSTVSAVSAVPSTPRRDWRLAPRPALVVAVRPPALLPVLRFPSAVALRAPLRPAAAKRSPLVDRPAGKVEGVATATARPPAVWDGDEVVDEMVDEVVDIASPALPHPPRRRTVTVAAEPQAHEPVEQEEVVEVVVEESAETPVAPLRRRVRVVTEVRRRPSLVIATPEYVGEPVAPDAPFASLTEFERMAAEYEDMGIEQAFAALGLGGLAEGFSSSAAPPASVSAPREPPPRPRVGRPTLGQSRRRGVGHPPSADESRDGEDDGEPEPASPGPTPPSEPAPAVPVVSERPPPVRLVPVDPVRPDDAPTLVDRPARPLKPRPAPVAPTAEKLPAVEVPPTVEVPPAAKVLLGRPPEPTAAPAPPEPEPFPLILPKPTVIESIDTVLPHPPSSQVVPHDAEQATEEPAALPLAPEPPPRERPPAEDRTPSPPDHPEPEAAPDPPPAPQTAASPPEATPRAEPTDSSTTPAPVRPTAVHRPPDRITRVPDDVVTVFRRELGVEVRDVPVLRGPVALGRATAARARALTAGGQVHLPAERGDLGERTTRGLLAHELTHAVQQHALGHALPAEDTPLGRELEREAQAVEHWFLGTLPGPPVLRHRPAPAVPTAPVLSDHTSHAQRAVDLAEPPAADPAEQVPTLSWTPDGGFTETAQPAGPAEPRPSPHVGAVEQAPGVDLSAVHARMDGLDAEIAEIRHWRDNHQPKLSFDRVARGVYPLLRARLRAELIVDRERAGALADPV